MGLISPTLTYFGKYKICHLPGVINNKLVQGENYEKSKIEINTKTN